MSSESLPEHLSFSGNGGSFPPHGRITADDHGPYVVITSWILMCVMVLTVVTRLGTRVKTGKDSFVISVGAVRTLILSILVLDQGISSTTY